MQDFKITNGMDTIITLLIFSVVLKKTVYYRILLAYSRQKNLLANDKLQENHGSYSSGRCQSNSTSDWLEKASTQLVTTHLCCKQESFNP